MKQIGTNTFARSGNSNQGIDRSARIEKITKLSRLSSSMELLESRTMMSAGTLVAPVPLLATAKSPSAKIVASATNAVSKPVVKNTVKPTSGPVKAVTVVTPAAPAGLTATGISGTQIKLTWTPSGSASGYYIFRSADGVHFTQVGKETGTTFTDTGLASGQAYKYQVQAFTSTATSAMSAVATGVTTLGAPAGLAVTLTSGSQIHLTWIDKDSSATGYAVLRSTDGKNFSPLSKLTSAGANSMDDKSLSPSTTYYYKVEATTAVATSSASNAASATTPLAVPAGVAATAISPTSVKINWTDSDPGAQGYAVYRAADGATFTQVATVASGKTTNWTDNAVTSNHKYTYEVKATSGSSASALSGGGAVTTPLIAPTGLAANSSGGSTVVLNWKDNDSSATGYTLSRGTDGVHFTTLTKITSGTASSYTDTTAASGQKYSYEIAATTATNASAVSNIATATTPQNPSPAKTTVTIATRYTGELVISATGTSDTVSVTESGSTLTIAADGQTTTQPVPTAGLFIYARGGTDGVTVDQSVTVRTTVEAIDGAVDDITSHGTNVSVWDDPNDVFIGTGTVHSVSTFAGGVSKAADASLKDPGDSGTIMHANASLWGTGPVAGDVNQGNSGDCYFLSSLAAFAGVKPAMLQESAVDMGDGTYAVQFISNNEPEYVRVSNDLPTYGNGSYLYARPGASGSIWAAIMEKAYAFFRTGANTYASISSGWMGDVYAALGVNSSFFYLSGMSESALYARLSADLAGGRAVTLGTSGNAPQLVSGHAYTLISCSVDKNGVTSYVVRNPWGVSGDSLENSQGYATLTFAQMVANFQDCCEATG